jgi:hypothetical protein
MSPSFSKGSWKYIQNLFLWSIPFFNQEVNQMKAPFRSVYRVAGEMDVMTFSEFKDQINDGSIRVGDVVYRYDFVKRGKIETIPVDNKVIWGS